MQFAIVMHKDKSSDYGVTVPGLPGCSSAGSSIDEALEMAKEAIEVYLEQLIEDGKTVPLPGRIEQHQRNSDYRGGVWALVTSVAQPASITSDQTGRAIPISRRLRVAGEL